jgi:hypothetical protein
MRFEQNIFDDFSKVYGYCTTYMFLEINILFIVNVITSKEAVIVRKFHWSQYSIADSHK